jgi:hypothetical protein
MARCETGKAPTCGQGFLAFVGALGSVRSRVIRLITSNAIAIAGAMRSASKSPSGSRFEAATMANRASTRTTRLYDRLSLDEIERITT